MRIFPEYDPHFFLPAFSAVTRLLRHFYGKRILLRLFLHIDQKPSTKKISVFDSFLPAHETQEAPAVSAQLPTLIEISRAISSLSLTGSSDRFHIIFFAKFSGPVSHKKYADLIVSFLIGNTCLLPCLDNLITDIKRQKDISALPLPFSALICVPSEYRSRSNAATR